MLMMLAAAQIESIDDESICCWYCTGLAAGHLGACTRLRDSAVGSA